MDVITARVPKYLNEEIKRRCKEEEDSISNFIRTCLFKELFIINSNENGHDSTHGTFEF